MKKLLLIILISFAVSKTLRILNDAQQNIQDQMQSSQQTKDQAKQSTFFDKMTNRTNTLLGLFQNIAKTFHSEHSETVKEIIKREGFSKLKLKSNVFVNVNLKATSYLNYMRRRGSVLGISDPDDLDNFITTVEFAPDSDKAGAGNTNLVYEDGKTDNSYDSLSVFVNEGTKEDCYDVMIHHFRIYEFQIADNLLWVQKTDDYFGIAKVTKDEFVRQPNTLTKEQVTALIEFYKMLSLSFVAETFGIKLDLPLS